MATTSPFLQPLLHNLRFPKRPFLPLNSPFSPRLHFLPPRFPSSSTIHARVESDIISRRQDEAKEADFIACPVCYEPLIRSGPSVLNVSAISRSGFKCKMCNKSYSTKDMYLDLTVTAGLKVYAEVQPKNIEIFRNPLVSFFYERGWRQIFNQTGFPGPHEEFKMAQEYFKPAEGGVLVDVSCGSGLLSRKFAKSGVYSSVIALDFSENMLRECYNFIKQDPLSTNNIGLVRADVSRLPFSSGSVDAVHAGAALHCWPSPSNAIAEITRVLRSGGVFVGTTFHRYTSSTPSTVQPLLELLVMQRYSYLTEEEIQDLCTSCGLTNYSRHIQHSFIMFSAHKP